MTPKSELFVKLPSDTKRSYELAVAVRNGEPEAFHRFCEFHLGLAERASQMLHHWLGIDQDDAFQIACIDLIQAAKHFDPKWGKQFFPIASYRLRQCCHTRGLEAAYLIQIPARVFWPLYRMQFTERRLLASFGMPVARERYYRICKNSGISIRDLVTFNRARNIQHVSALPKREWVSYRSIKDHRESPLERLLWKDLRRHIRREMDRLTEREKVVLYCRYGFGGKRMTLDEIAAMYGLTKERIRNIQIRAEERLKLYLSLSILDRASDENTDTEHTDV